MEWWYEYFSFSFIQTLYGAEEMSDILPLIGQGVKIYTASLLKTKLYG